MTRTEYQRCWREKNRDAYNTYQREWRAANREKLNAARRVLHKTDPWRFKKHELKKRYGITGEQFVALVQAQGGLCALCSRPPRGERGLVVDHCHATGVVRGLLCNQCNCGIGKLSDSPAILRAGAAYLEERVNGVLPRKERIPT